MPNPKILVLDRGEELAGQLQGIAEELRPTPEIVVCTRMGAVAEVLEAEGPFDVLVAGPSLGTRSGLARLRVIREDQPATSLLLAFSRRPDADLTDIVRTGAIDLVRLPVEGADLVDAVNRALALSQVKAQAAAVAAATVAGQQSVGTDGMPAAAPGSTLARTFTISSATGGCGKTFYATNLAYFLTRYTGKRACIVDLDLQFGEVSTALRMRPKFTIFDALQREDTDEDDLREHIEEYTVQHETGVHILAAPREPSEADRISPPDVTRIVEAVRKNFDYVVIDTPPQLNELVLAAFDLSDGLYVMATLDLPSVRNMSVFLSTLERLKVSADNVKLILNKAESDVGIDIDQVTRLFPQGFESVLPYAKEVSRSINLGMPVMAASPQAEISRLMTSGMRSILPPEHQSKLVTEPTPTKKGMFRRKGR
jgi:pilus assembly protein CpaE